MKEIICSKCNTPNEVGAPKCVTCGFPFSAEKMHTVGKYVGEITPNLPDAEKNTPFLTDEIEPQGSVSDQNIDLQQSLIPTDVLNSNKNQPEEKNIQGLSLEVESESEKFPHSESVASELKNINPEKSNIEDLNDMTQENQCRKCGYILSEFSKTCPSCGHENFDITATVRMPENSFPNPDDDMNKTQSIHQMDLYDDTDHNTGSYPMKKSKVDPGQTIAEHQNNESSFQDYIKPYDEVTSTPETTNRGDQRKNNPNVTIREGFEPHTGAESFSDFGSEDTIKPNEPKSKTRLEAIYLGQDAEQKMLINIPEHSERIIINRALIDQNDSTLSATEHALIFKEDDQWKIQNKASNKAVFVQVNDISTLKNGDIVMLGGDKFYIFIDENQEK